MIKHLLLLLFVVTAGCSAGRLKTLIPTPDAPVTIVTNVTGKGPEINLELHKGEYFYYPLMAVWLETGEGDYIQTLYVAKSVATGIFRYGRQEKNRWISGPLRAPQTLPYWAHKRGVIASDGLYIPEPDNPVPDAYTGATPLTSFILNSKSDSPLPEIFKVMLEINQNWDWNEYWTNDKFPGDEYYMKSCQPALVYEVTVRTDEKASTCHMKPVGHSHYSGKDGELYKDLSTLTTALHIADSIIVRVK